MKKILIIGSGGFGREVLWIIKRINEAAVLQGSCQPWDVVGFIDDDESLHGTQQDGYFVLGGCEYFQTLSQEVYAVIAVGRAKSKREIAEKLTSYINVQFATLIDPSVMLSDHVEIGEGSILCAGTILTVDIHIGKHVSINLDCTVGHDVVIEDYVTVYPSVNVSGNVHIGEAAELGTGAQILQGKEIGGECVIGAGAVVVQDIPEQCTAVGVPAEFV